MIQQSNLWFSSILYAYRHQITGIFQWLSLQCYPRLSKTDNRSQRGRKPKNQAIIKGNIAEMPEECEQQRLPKWQVKQQAKMQQQGSIRKQMTVTWKEEQNKRRVVNLEYIDNPAEATPQYLENQKFSPSDMWNNDRIFSKANAYSVSIPSLVELPLKNHEFIPPSAYIDPLYNTKKRKYRPVAPRIFHTGFDSFMERRAKNRQAGIQKDLSVFSLDEIIEQCHKKRLISESLSSKHFNMNGTLHIKNYLQFFINGLLHRYDFQRSNFTLIDHRRLVELLMHFHPLEYTFKYIDALHLDVRQFLTHIYALEAEDYVRFYLTHDSLSGMTWWKELQERYKGKQEESYFQIKEKLGKANLVVDLYGSNEEKSFYLKNKLKNLRLQDNQAELQKILSNKFNRQQQRVFSSLQSAPSQATARYDEDDSSQQIGSEFNQPGYSMQDNDMSEPVKPPSSKNKAKKSKKKSSNSSKQINWQKVLYSKKDSRNQNQDFDE